MTGTVSIIIPAGGRSERMGAANKLLLELDGRRVLEHVIDAAVKAGPLEVLVVTGSGRENVERAVRSFDLDGVGRRRPQEIRCVHNPDFEEGMAASLRAGIAAASGDALGYAILLADMPFIQVGTIGLLADRLTADRIVVPLYEGRRGHPVLFGRTFRDELLALQGDAGGRRVTYAHPNAVVQIETGDPGTVRDIDTEQDYRSAVGRL